MSLDSDPAAVISHFLIIHLRTGVVFGLTGKRPPRELDLNECKENQVVVMTGELLVCLTFEPVSPQPLMLMSKDVNVKALF